ncbi:MAG: ABC transporter ATP-binding protein [Clostridia bacterium]|nr:ABC transporter ATP-binding protein [Clostridia bacterium]MBR0267523.1 ABC transporter ATP-binding protein [Clostridia bacterium]
MDNALRWLWRVTGRKKGYVLALTLIQGVSGALGVLYALLLRNIVDSAVGHEVSAFWHNVALIVALVVLQISLSAVIRWLQELAKADIENRFKQRLMDNILRKEYSAVSATHTAEWLNRLTSDTTVVAGGIVEILPGLVGTVVRLVSAVVMVIALDRMFAVILVPGGIALCALTYAFRKVLKRLHKNIQESDGRLRIFLQERIGSLMMIKSFVAEAQTSRDAAQAMADHKAARMRRNRFSNVANIGFAAAMQGMYLLGVVYCAYGIMTGSVTYGTLTAIMQLIGQIQGPFVSISGYLPRFYAMTASAERLMEIEAFADDGTARDADDVYEYYLDSFSVLGLRNASFTYESGDAAPVVLDGVSVEIKKGEYVAFTGHSGCGKSTVLKLLMCMYPLDGGERYLTGDQGEITLDASWRRLFAYVPQGNALMNGTIREIVSFADPDAAHDGHRLRRALEISCADEFVDDPDAVLGERGSGLSEGQMQRLAIARAVFSDCPVLLLDEATSALDDLTEQRLLQNLRAMTDMTVVIVTHRKAALGICDRVLRFTEAGIEDVTDQKEQREG